MKGINMCDFVTGRCKALKDSEKFLADWCKTNRDPCSTCGTDKANCSFYKKMLDMGVIGDKVNLL